MASLVSSMGFENVLLVYAKFPENEGVSCCERISYSSVAWAGFKVSRTSAVAAGVVEPGVVGTWPITVMT